MNRDYAKYKTTKSKPIKPKQHRAIFLFIILIFGALLTTGLSYLHKHSVKSKSAAHKPLNNKTKPENKTNIEAITGPISPEFDFYTLLPQKKSVTLPQYELEITVTDDHLIVDQLKAKLLVLGFDVTITELTKNGKPHYRLTLGPYDTKKIAKHDQQQLQNNNIRNTLNQLK